MTINSVSDLSSIRPTLILECSMNHKSVPHQEKQSQEVKRNFINSSEISLPRTLLDGQKDRSRPDHFQSGSCRGIGSVPGQYLPQRAWGHAKTSKHQHKSKEAPGAVGTSSFQQLHVLSMGHLQLSSSKSMHQTLCSCQCVVAQWDTNDSERWQKKFAKCAGMVVHACKSSTQEGKAGGS
jgi:hypothetical protein